VHGFQHSIHMQFGLDHIKHWLKQQSSVLFWSSARSTGVKQRTRVSGTLWPSSADN